MGRGGGNIGQPCPPRPPPRTSPGSGFSLAPFWWFPAVVSQSKLGAGPQAGVPLAPPFSTSFRTDISDFIAPGGRRTENAVQ